jgi:molecular chaperone GrpE
LKSISILGVFMTTRDESVKENGASIAPISDSAEAVATVRDDTTLTETLASPDALEATADPSVRIEELTHQLAEATQKAEKYWDGLLRKQADFDNFQRRMTRDLEHAHKYALEKFATELLSVKDSMELGLEAATKPDTDLSTVREGIALTLKMLADSLKKFDIVEIYPLNDKFNPQWHEAMAMQPVPNVQEGSVLYVHQKGYQLHDRLLRPARVVVAKSIEPPQNNP